MRKRVGLLVSIVAVAALAASAGRAFPLFEHPTSVSADAREGPAPSPPAAGDAATVPRLRGAAKDLGLCAAPGCTALRRPCPMAGMCEWKRPLPCPRVYRCVPLRCPGSCPVGAPNGSGSAWTRGGHRPIPCGPALCARGEAGTDLRRAHAGAGLGARGDAVRGR